MSNAPAPATPEFQHLLAYGNSDQASFRNPQVRNTFDIMTVPGTIASYYDEGTAAFVLANQMPYLIDPRTPLFQEDLRNPRASHYSLADWHGPAVRSQLPERGTPGIGHFPASFWTERVIDEMVEQVIGRQRRYADNAERVTPKLDRNARLLAAAMQAEGLPVPGGSPVMPRDVLAPYFAVSGPRDPWRIVLESVWRACEELPNPAGISPVLCVGTPSGQGGALDRVGALEEILSAVPEELGGTCYFWITNFDERQADEHALRRLWDVVQQTSYMRLVNLYGGFFSICLRHAGLAGFNSGLTYSESRAWPALDATGAAPPRYYVRRLHMFLPPASAALLLQYVPALACDCAACGELLARGESIAAMPYHDLKRHFALARQWELSQTKSRTTSDISKHLRFVHKLVEDARPSLPPGAGPQTSFLLRWANVLDSV